MTEPKEFKIGVFDGWEATGIVAEISPLCSVLFQKSDENGIISVRCGVDTDKGIFLSEPPVDFTYWEQHVIFEGLMQAQLDLACEDAKDGCLLRFSSVATKRIDEIMKKSCLESRGTTVRRAMRLYEWYLDAIAKGDKLLRRDESDNIFEIEFEW